MFIAIFICYFPGQSHTLFEVFLKQGSFHIQNLQIHRCITRFCLTNHFKVGSVFFWILQIGRAGTHHHTIHIHPKIISLFIPLINIRIPIQKAENNIIFRNAHKSPHQQIVLLLLQLLFRKGRKIA